MQILGHSQITLTLGTYSHVVPELAHDAAQRIAAVFWGESETAYAQQLAANTDQGERAVNAYPL
jgi:hypothetical protein